MISECGQTPLHTAPRAHTQGRGQKGEKGIEASGRQSTKKKKMIERRSFHTGSHIKSRTVTGYKYKA